MKFFLKHLRIIAHVAFWLGYFFVIIYTFSAIFNFDAVLGRTAIVGCLHIILVYTHLYYLIPKFLKKKKIVAYILSLIGLVLISIPLKIFVLLTIFGHFFEQFKVQPDFPIVLNGLIGSGVLLVITTGLWYAEQGIINLRAQEELTRVKLEGELQMLRSQINPHFLFNVLNNIYSLSYTGSDKAPASILKLSEMLRYMLYDSKNKMVNLSNEIDYLNNYIELQKIKSGDTLNIAFSVEGLEKDQLIPPLLLIPFFENAIKHGELDRRKNGFFKAKLVLSQNRLTFSCANLIKQSTSSLNEPGGIGINNVKSRLKLIYPNQHQLTIHNLENNYTVELKITLNAKPTA
ncbi:MAG: sensor histidine kinase [Bacteroidia bacterium]